MPRLLAGAALIAMVAGLGCQTAAVPPDAGCIDAGANTVCGDPEQFPVRFAGLAFPLYGDAGPTTGNAEQPLSNEMEIILADHDLSGACGGDPSKLVAFTGVQIYVNGYFQNVDAGTYTSPTASVYEFTFVPDAGSAGTQDLGESDTATVLLTNVNGQTSATGYFNAGMALPQTGVVQLYGNFTAKSCQGLLQALCGQDLSGTCLW